MAAVAATLQQKGQFLEQEAHNHIAVLNDRILQLCSTLNQVISERDDLKASRAVQDTLIAELKANSAAQDILIAELKARCVAYDLITEECHVLCERSAVPLRHKAQASTSGLKNSTLR